MSSRAVFGDFLEAAHRHLDPANHSHGPGGAGGGADEAARALLHVIAVMRRHVADVSAPQSALPAGRWAGRGPWARAQIQAQDALTSAAGYLHPYRPGRRASRPAVSQLARRLDGVAVSLTAGRDLLWTHFESRPDGARVDRSEWAAVISSPSASRALLAELASLAREIARQGNELAIGPAPDARTTADARRRLNAACQWLLAFDAAIREARRAEPVAGRDRELLWAIPASAVAPRRVPGPDDPVPALCQGVIDAAERLRRAAWMMTAEPGRWPVTVTSLRRTAQASIATSHHCGIVLRTLADQATQPGFPGVSEDLLAAADAVGHARRAWVGSVDSLERVTTDMKGYVSPVAGEAASLGLRTGRLAYADPSWAPDLGPAHATRAPGELAARPEDVQGVIAAVHHASDALVRLAEADRVQVWVGERGGRILVPTRSLPEEYDIPRPFGPAPHDRVEPVLAAYQDAGTASGDAVVAVGAVAEKVGAPSRIITMAGAAADAASHSGRVGPARAEEPDDTAESAAVDTAQPGGKQGERRPQREPGPVERTLLDIGVTNPDVLQRGADVDRAAVQVILDAAADERKTTRATPMLMRSRRSAELVNHVLTVGDLRAAALLRRPPVRHEIAAEAAGGARTRPEREAPEREP